MAVMRDGLTQAGKWLQQATAGLLRPTAKPDRVTEPAYSDTDLSNGILRHAVWNTKVMGSALARQRYAAGLAGPGLTAPAMPMHVGLEGGTCRQRDMEALWLHHWCRRLGMAPIYHRKVWEDTFVLQALWEAGMMEPGRRGLGFAVGRETLPSFFASQGVTVLATDLHAEDGRGRGWRETGQHSLSADMLHFPHIIGLDDFRARVSFEPVDMTSIPPSLTRGEFDFIWSVCSLEHLGSIEAGIEYVLQAMACLRPGGIAVHTTEFNVANEGPTVETGGTVLFQRQHIETMMERLVAAGHIPAPMDFDPGDGILDAFVDLPPFAHLDGSLTMPDTPHLRLSLGGHVATSIGMIIRAGG